MEWSQLSSPTLAPIANLKSTPDASQPEVAGCTWPPEKSCEPTQMVAAWKSNNDLPKFRQMNEPHVGGVPRSVLSRLFATPTGSAPGTPIRSPRRRCSAGTASVAAMVYSPRQFVNGDRIPLESRDSGSQTMPFQQCGSPVIPTPVFGSCESGGSCNGPIPMSNFPDYPIPSDDEDSCEEEEVTMLRQQVALLVKGLEDEKKRRATEQFLMQKKIIELQGLIRGNANDDLDMEQAEVDNTMTSPMEIPSSRENKQVDSIGEAAAKLQLTRLRARMHAIVIDSQRETQSLRSQLEGTKRNHNKREKQLMLETTIKVSALEQKHAAATTRLAQQAANSAAHVEVLETEKQELLACIQAQRERLEQLELALGGKRIVEASR
ncbi:hypothetical protein PHYBOEH_008207 [Phytophthora boehmeriae]|uniref:Uncharacterized protein n=1 Tax=Phytophthora boehmeriae TaxID=109152 RepID=A0A8T1X893_9STRA|nr:hypothetical protein PHYBOEH_008207 [Phytophthora boehmeriae]